MPKLCHHFYASTLNSKIIGDVVFFSKHSSHWYFFKLQRRFLPLITKIIISNRCCAEIQSRVWKQDHPWQWIPTWKPNILFREFLSKILCSLNFQALGAPQVMITAFSPQITMLRNIIGFLRLVIWTWNSTIF